ncbi:hypothetical protein ES703_26641 [subsurface metagenome]
MRGRSHFATREGRQLGDNKEEPAPEDLPSTLRGARRIGSYAGKVISYRAPIDKEDSDEGQILFEGKDYKFAWSFRGEKMRAAGADFEGAKVQYDVYVAGPTTIATLRCLGPETERGSRKTILSMSQDELEELSR